MTTVLAQSSDAKKAMATASSIFELIGNHQKALDTNNEKLEDKTILQLSNNKVKVNKRKKVKKNGNNNK